MKHPVMLGLLVVALVVIAVSVLGTGVHPAGVIDPEAIYKAIQ